MTNVSLRGLLFIIEVGNLGIPPSKTTANLFDLPLMSQLPVVTIRNANIQKPRDCANRQQTTMAKYGASSCYRYPRILTPGEKISIANSSELGPKIVHTDYKEKS